MRWNEKRPPIYVKCYEECFSFLPPVLNPALRCFIKLNYKCQEGPFSLEMSPRILLFVQLKVSCKINPVLSENKIINIKPSIKHGF